MQKSMKYLATSTMQDVSSITIMPPEPMIEPTLRQRLVVHRHVEVLLGDASARRSACLHGLELPAVGNAAADLKTISRSVIAHRHFDQPGVVDPSGQGEDLRPFALLRADAGKPLRRRCG